MDMTKRQFRLGMMALALTGIAACQPVVPDSGAGVGFGDYSEYQQQREAQLAGRASAVPAAPMVTSQPLDGTGTANAADPASDAEALAAEASAAIARAGSNSGQQPLDASPSNPAPVAVNQMGISQENDFDAVGEQRSIASDRALIEENRANYTQVQPEALPARSNTGPNIVAYALQTSHAVGQQQYRRTNFGGASRYERNCAGYPSPDLAQTDFLKSGGPERDRKGLDPDGDGYACSWDPRPFRKAAGG